METGTGSFSNNFDSNPLNNARFNNRAARFYWAEEESSPQRAYSIQQIGKISSDSHFEESPLVIASISAGVIGVAIIIIIIIGIWIRSRLFTVGEGRGSQTQNNTSVRSSTSTLEDDAYVVCMEMDGAVLGSMHNDASNYCENSTALEKEVNDASKADIMLPVVPEAFDDQSFSMDSSPANDNRIVVKEEPNTETMA